MKARYRKLVDLLDVDEGPEFRFRVRLMAELRKRGVITDLTVVGLGGKFGNVRIWVKVEHLCCARTILAALEADRKAEARYAALKALAFGRIPETPQSSVEQKDGERP